MRRNCNLELRLVSFSDSDNQNQDEQTLKGKESNNGSESPQNMQQLTIFYNGRVCVSNVTEFQARAILSLANREMEDKLKTPIGTPTGAPIGPELASPSTLPSPICSPNMGLSMKRSIQRFLQKRKHRAQAISPYHH